MTAKELEAINGVVDRIGAGLDALCDLLNAIEAKGQTKRRKAVLDSLSADCRAAAKISTKKTKAK